jgi:hypothetical protein
VKELRQLAEDNARLRKGLGELPLDKDMPQKRGCDRPARRRDPARTK